MTYDISDDWLTDPALAARKAVQPMLDAKTMRLETELRSMRSQLDQQRVFAQLDADPEVGSKWRAVNDAPAFLQWLDGVHEFSGQKRMTLLRQAFNNGWSHQVRSIFAAYIRQRDIPERMRTLGHRNEFERQSPQNRPRHPDTDIRGRRVWTRAAIARFYEDVRAGRYDGRDTERLRTEQEILAAARQNRVPDAPVPAGKGHLG